MNNANTQNKHTKHNKTKTQKKTKKNRNKKKNKTKNDRTNTEDNSQIDRYVSSLSGNLLFNFLNHVSIHSRLAGSAKAANRFFQGA